MRGALLLCLSLAACATTKESATPPTLPDRYAKCSIQKSQSRPLIVEWPSTDRASLESLSKRGLVAVRYTGCEMEVLSRCKVKGEYKYKYTPVTLQSERITIDDADELYANVPVGAAKLEGELEKSGQLNVDTSIVGTYDAGETVARDDLDGDCDKATHVLTSLTVGAFEFYSGAAVSAGGGVVAFGVGAGGKTRSQQTLLSRSGSGDACRGATGSDERPPEGCGALLRVEATPIAATRAKAAPAVEPPVEEPPPSEAPPVVEPEAAEPVASEPPSEPPPSGEPTPTIQDSIGPPPPRGDVDFGPGFLLGLRGPFAVNFGRLEEGVELSRYSPISAGFVLEIGYRLSSTISIAATGSISGGSSSSSNDECPSGAKCRALLLGAGADVIVTPRGDERLWLGLGAEYSYIRMTREGEYKDDAGAQHTIDTDRRYGAVGPRISIGTDFADPYVSWIQYGFMIGYSMRFGLSASGKNRRDDVDEPLSGKPGINHTILFLGRFHFDAGVVRSDSKS